MTHVIDTYELSPMQAGMLYENAVHFASCRENEANSARGRRGKPLESFEKLGANYEKAS